MALSDYLRFRGCKHIEGNCQQIYGQVTDLIALSSGGIDKESERPLRIMEIGFNAGHSAEVFLNNNCKYLVSFDLGDHDYVMVAKEYMDRIYPNRHQLVLGDSRETIPKFMAQFPESEFDLIFIDGGHDYDIAKSDLENCLKIATKDTLIIMDDIVEGQQYQWTYGPTRAWSEKVSEKKIQHIGHREYYSGRGMAWGKIISVKSDGVDPR